MANKSFFNGTDAELYTGAQNFVTVIGKNLQQYGLTNDQLASFTTANNIFSAAYLAAVGPETRTKGKVAAKNAAKSARSSWLHRTFRRSSMARLPLPIR